MADSTRKNTVTVTGHEYQAQHIAPLIVMGKSKSGDNENSLLVNERLSKLIERGKWNPDSAENNLILLPAEDKYSDTTGVTKHRNTSHTGYSRWYNEQVNRIFDEVEGRGGTDDDVVKQLIGLNNFLKSEYVDPDSPLNLHGNQDAAYIALRDDVQGRFNYASYSQSDEFKLGAELGKAIRVRTDSSGQVEADDPYDTANGQTKADRASALEDQKATLKKALADYDAAKSGSGDSAESVAKENAKGVARGDLSEQDYDDLKSGDTHFVRSGDNIYLSRKFAGDAFHVLDLLGKGTALVDVVTIGLLGYSLNKSGALQEVTLASVTSLLMNSNLRDIARAKLGDFAADAAQELAVSGLLTMLGVGVLWKGYEIYQSLDGLKEAVKLARDVGDSATIDRLGTAVDKIEEWFGTSGSPAGSGSESVQYVTLIRTMFGNGSQEEAVLAEALGEHFGLQGADLPTILEGLEQGLDPNESVQDALGRIVLDSPFIAKVADRDATLAKVLAMESDSCFLAGTMIRMADGSEKPIEEIGVGDEVISFDRAGVLVPGRVTRTFRNDVKVVLNWFGTFVTPGHVYFCAEGQWAGRFATLIDILRDDGAVQHQDGRLIRAGTGAEVGSGLDRFVEAVVGPRDDTGCVSALRSGRLRLGTRILMDDGRDFCLADVIAANGGQVNAAGLIVVGKDAQGAPFHWTFSNDLPRPEDYVLHLSGTTLEAIFAAGEWDDGRPVLPGPTVPDEATGSLPDKPRNEPIGLTSNGRTASSPAELLVKNTSKRPWVN